MVDCRFHNYVQTTRGDFVCTKCGKLKGTKSRKSEFAGIFAIFLGILFIGIMVTSSNVADNISNDYSEEISQKNNPEENTVEKTIDTEEKIQPATRSIPEQDTLAPTSEQLRDEDLSEKELVTALEIHKLINIERHNAGLSQLDFDKKLSTIAHHHSKDMANNGYFSHISKDGLDPTQRGERVGYICHKEFSGYYVEGLGENIHKQSSSSFTYFESPEKIAENTVHGWMESEGHRNNILDDQYDTEGIGVSITNFEVYVTQNFC